MAEPDDVESRLRLHARTILDAALAAVDPEALVRRALRDDPSTSPRGPGRTHLVAVGKAAGAMASGAVAALEGAVDRCVVVVPRGGGGAPGGATLVEAGHPLPDRGSVEAGRTVSALVREAGPDDRIVLLLSGGGSALLALPPPGVTLDHVRATTEALLRGGATIAELNAVRKRLDELKGGGLAVAAAPATLRVLVLSDVVGDRLDVIASGPAAPDRSSWTDALAAVERRGGTGVPEGVVDLLERGARGELPGPPGPDHPAFRSVRTQVVGNAETAARAAVRAAERLGYPARLDSTTVTGEAREVGAELGRVLADVEGPAARVWAGETTVTVTGPGRGGRNQELALGAARALADRPWRLLLSAGTDGVDGPTDAAGALVDHRTLERAERAGVDPGRALERNDAYAFFEALDDLVVTGPTGTNVMDLMVGLVASTSSPG